jgi:imidazolonepropionase-like amidohydrolase
MKRLWFALVFVAISARGETLAIIGAEVWTNASDAPIKDATIVITDGRIVSITSGAPPPANARILRAAGEVVTPPLDAAATQIGLVELASASDTDDRAVSSGPLGAAFDVSMGVDGNDLSVQQARAAGVAHAMVFPSPASNGIFAGQGARVDLSHPVDIVEHARVAMFVTAGGAAAKAAGGSRGAMWGLLRTSLDEARVLRGSTNVFKPRDQLQNHADLEALRPVLERRMPLAVVANREADIRQAISVGHDYRISIVIVGGAEAWRMADLLAASHVPVILDPLDELPVSFDALGARRDNAALLSRAGVLIAFTVSGQTIYLSYNLGSALREGAGIAVANGLPYPQAIRAITQSAGRIWDEPAAAGKPGGAGTLAPGAAADLVIWDADPLEPSSAPAVVMFGGREISLQTRQTLLRDRYRPPAAGPRAAPHSP